MQFENNNGSSLRIIVVVVVLVVLGVNCFVMGAISVICAPLVSGLCWLGSKCVRQGVTLTLAAQRQALARATDVIDSLSHQITIYFLT